VAARVSCWVTEQTGISVTTSAAVPDLEPELAGSVGLALRRNPKRAQLLVSSVLGKHVPVRASLCLRAGERLAQAVPVPGPYDVIGFAETATGLGHQVAQALQAATYVHTTRRPSAGDPRLSFLEEHSHATDQALTPEAGALDGSRVAVLVDDEISTGRTALNAIAALAPATGHTTWVLATLLDTRSVADRAACAQRAQELGITLLHACLLTGSVTVPEGAGERAAALLTPPPGPLAGPAPRALRLGSRGLRTTARRAFSVDDGLALRHLAASAAAALELGPDLLVVGDEELMHFPQLLALALGDAQVCTTTRSPALAVDAPGYPLRSAVCFDAVGEPGRAAYSYNTVRTGTTLLVTEDPADRCGGAAAGLGSGGAEVVVLVLDPSLDAGVLR
jgi:adenine/guanine phosphoribosyltransferase-like PRPP-binding protein